MTKHLGGRGRRTENKYQTVTISLSPELKSLLDSWVTEEVSRSEVVAQLIEAHAQALSLKRGEGSNTPRPSLEAPSRPSEGLSVATKSATTKSIVGKSNKSGQRGKTKRLALSAPVLHVMQRTIDRTTRGQLRWSKEKYAQAEALLAEGNQLQAQGVDYVTEKGDVMSWRTAEALVKLGVLVVPPR